jgi:hypothetical protein
MKKLTLAMVWMVLTVIFLTGKNSQAQEPDLYTEGSVWNITFVKIHANMDDDYLKGLTKTWKASMDGLVNGKLIKSYKILKGQAANPQDFNLILMTEMENFASMDPNPEKDKKMDEIEKKVRDAMGDEFQKTVTSYTTMRDITGTKTMREIFLK